MFEQSAANDRMDYERIGRFIYSFHRVCGSVDELNISASGVNVPPELAARAANLAQKFDRILKNCGSVAEGELESTLREASEVQTGLDMPEPAHSKIEAGPAALSSQNRQHEM